MSISSKKMLGVTFNMSDPLEREIVHFTEENTDNFSNLVKHLLFAWRYGYMEVDIQCKQAQTTKETYEIRNSGIPFG